MTQTPITKAIEQLSQYRDTYNPMCDEFTMIDNCVEKLTDLLPYEREVIEGAFRDGDHNEDFNSQSDYFTKTFTNNGND